MLLPWSQIINIESKPMSFWFFTLAPPYTTSTSETPTVHLLGLLALAAIIKGLKKCLTVTTTQAHYKKLKFFTKMLYGGPGFIKLYLMFFSLLTNSP
jgi:hypothetical protein